MTPEHKVIPTSYRRTNSTGIYDGTFSLIVLSTRDVNIGFFPNPDIEFKNLV